MRKNQIPVTIAKDKKSIWQYVAVTLVMNDWRLLFTEDLYKIIVARALNHCIEEHKLIVNGYIIAQRKLCLVIHMRGDSLDKPLMIFHERLLEEILRHLDQEKIKAGEKFTRESKKLFSRLSSSNHILVQLITGRQIEMPYYNPHFERLKKSVSQNSFCSAHDYAHVTGPVRVTMLKDKKVHINLYEWEIRIN